MSDERDGSDPMGPRLRAPDGPGKSRTDDTGQFFSALHTAQYPTAGRTAR